MIENDADSIIECIELAKSGSRERAFEILEEIVFSITNNEVPNWIFLKYLANCLEPILEDGVDANEALNIKRKRGEKHSRKTLDRDRMIAYRIKMYQAYDESTIEAAMEKARLNDYPDVGEEVIRKAYLRHRAWADKFASKYGF